MTRLTLLGVCLLAATVSAGGNKPAVRIIDGKEVVAKRAMQSHGRYTTSFRAPTALNGRLAPEGAQ